MDREQAEEIVQRPFREYVRGLTPEEYVLEMNDLLQILFLEDLVEMIPEEYLTFTIGSDALLYALDNSLLRKHILMEIERSFNAAVNDEVVEMVITPLYDHPDTNELEFEYFIWIDDGRQKFTFTDPNSSLNPNILSPRELVYFLNHIMWMEHAILDSDMEDINLQYRNRRKSARK